MLTAQPGSQLWNSILLAPIAGQSVLTIAIAVAYAYPKKRLSIGSLFNEESMLQTHSAFRYELDRYNNSSSSEYSIQRYEKQLDTTDSYQMTKSICWAMERGIFAIFGVTDRATMATADSLSRTFNVPFITSSLPFRDPCNCLPPSSPATPPPSSPTPSLSDSSAAPPPPLSPPTPPSMPSMSPQSSMSRGRSYQEPPTGSTILGGGSADSATLSTNPGDYLLYIRPFYDKPMLSVIQYYRWTRIFYIYDTDAGLFRLEQLYSAANNATYSLHIDWIRIVSVNNCYVSLRRIDALPGDKHIILDFSTQPALESVLKQIQNVGMHRNGYHYLLGGLVMDELDLIRFRYGGVNITGFRLIDPEQPSIQSIRRDWQRLNPALWRGAGPGNSLQMDAILAMDAASVVIQALTSFMRQEPQSVKFRRGDPFNHENPSIQCSTSPVEPWSIGPLFMKYLRNVKMTGLTGPIAFDDHGYRSDYKLDVVELVFNSEPIKIGVWNSSAGLAISRPVVGDDHRDRQKSANATRVVTTIISFPFLSWRKKPDDGTELTGNKRFEGYCADVAEYLLERKLHINYELKLVDDGKYGANWGNGSWNGMVGELTEGKADLAIAPLTITSQRERVIDFSKPFMQLGISIMIKKPEKQKPGVFSFMDPLSYQIWMCIVLSYLAVSFVLFLVSRFSPYEWQIEDTSAGPTFTNDFTVLNSLWFSLGAFMQQGCSMSPRSVSGRVAGSAWWFFTLIIISTYTANLAAFLTVERMLTPIESADDLVKQTEIQYGTLDAGSTKDFFRTSKITVYEKMYSYMQSHPEVYVQTTDDGVSRVRSSKGKYAFLLESTMNEYHNQRKPCNTMKVGENLDSKGYGIATPVGSDLKDRIGLAVLELREAGDLQKLYKKWWYDKGECAPEGDGKGGSSQSALTLSNVAGIFYILISGLGVSMVASLLEFLCKTRKSDGTKSKKQQAILARTSSSNSHMKSEDDVDTAIVTTPGDYNCIVGRYAVANTVVGLTSYVNSPGAEQFTLTSPIMSRSSLV